MKTYLLPALFVVLLATALVTQAQFTPPTTTPSCNPSSANCGVPPPINVGPQSQTKKGPLTIEGTTPANPAATPTLFEVKNGNILLKGARIISDTNAVNSNPAWTLASPLSQIFAVDTDAAISAHGLLSTNYIYAASDIYSVALSLPITTPNYASIPAQRSLCADKVTGKIIACGSTTSSGGGVTPPSTTAISIAVKNLLINGSPASVSGTHPIIDISSPNTKVQFDWEVTPNDFNNIACWNSGTIAPPAIFLSPVFLKGKIDNRINQSETWALVCRNKSTGVMAQMQIFFSYTANNTGNTATPLPADVDISDTEGTIRWRENTMPIRLTTTIDPNGSTTTCTKYASIYSSSNKTILANNPWTNNTNIGKTHGTTGDTTAYSVRNQIIHNDPFTETKEYKCSDFVFNCPHAAEGTVSVNLKIECYNGKNGQTKSSPMRQSVTLQWINPD